MCLLRKSRWADGPNLLRGQTLIVSDLMWNPPPAEHDVRDSLRKRKTGQIFRPSEIRGYG